MSDKRLVNSIDVHEFCDGAWAEGRKFCCCHYEHKCTWVFCKNCDEVALNCDCGNFEGVAEGREGK